MVIDRKTKVWESNGRYATTNYTGRPDEEVWVIPNNSPLANKIRSLGLRWNPITDEHGNLIDVEWDGTEKVIPERIPTAQEDLNALVIDHEYRLTLLELGITE